jgi:regulator of RNase E activity RraA
MRVAGPAVTVRVPPGDNLMVWKALEIAQPGDVLAIETRGYTSVAVWGDITSLIAQQRGLAGIVTDGAVRDLAGILEVGLPVYYSGVTTPNGALKDGPGEVNVPIAVGNVAVLPGDVLVGDAGGVVVIPGRDAEEVLERARQMAENEARKIAQIRGGDVSAPWLEPVLQAKGCFVTAGPWRDR